LLHYIKLLSRTLLLLLFSFIITSISLPSGVIQAQNSSFTYIKKPEYNTPMCYIEGKNQIWIEEGSRQLESGGTLRYTKNAEKYYIKSTKIEGNPTVNISGNILPKEFEPGRTATLTDFRLIPLDNIAGGNAAKTIYTTTFKKRYIP